MALIATPLREIALAITDRPTARRELNFTASTWTHVLSIGDPGGRLAVSSRRFGDRLLRLEFDDVDPAKVGASPEAVWARWGYSAATAGHVQAVATFGRELPAGAHLLVHCEQGVSRSTAAAAIVLMARYGLSEGEALAFVRDIRPQARPNGWMLRLYAGAQP